MPKYIVGCKDGHNKEFQIPFAEFDIFKIVVEWAKCAASTGTIENKACRKRRYIKPQAVPFSIQPGFYDSINTGSVQEKQLRREGYRG